ncbi:MipA/OmpV family protein [Brevundimonas sp.]|uniref:MipA/OmpV family protein n=1 Tax=Brevundimonas sp. TaxID=1871086 RepID=UPI003F70E8E1
MPSFHRLAAAVAVAAFSPPPAFAHAGALAGDEDPLVIGAGALAYRSPFEGEGVSVFSIPIIVARRGAFYVDGLEAGATWAPPSTGAYSVTVDGFIAARALPGENREQVTADAGVRVSLEGPVGTVSVDYRRDISGEFEGGEATARYEIALPVGAVRVTPGAQVVWQDRATANHMYGVSPKQRREMIEDGVATPLPVFEIREGGVSLGADLKVLWPVTDRLVAIAYVSGAYLGDSVRENPGLRDDFEVQTLAGFGYRF